MTTIAVTCSNNRAVMMAESGITDEAFHTAPPMNKIVRQGDCIMIKPKKNTEFLRGYRHLTEKEYRKYLILES